MAEDLGPYIYLPVPSLKDLPNPSASRDEKLRTIISNLDKQHHMVRQNIISAAKKRYDAQQEAATSVAESNPDAMEVSPTSPPSDGEITSNEDPDPLLTHTQSLSSSPAIQPLLHNLNAEYTGIGDPCLPPFQPSRPNSTGNAAALGIRQATPPPCIAAANDVLRQIDAYDAIAAEGREYYVKALRRGSSGASTSARPVPMGYGGSGGAAGGYGGRPANASPATWSSAASPRVNASPIDASRDPRRKGR